MRSRWEEHRLRVCESTTLKKIFDLREDEEEARKGERRPWKTAQ